MSFLAFVACSREHDLQFRCNTSGIASEIHLSKLIRRQFSHSECCQNKNARREAKFFGKLMGTGSPKKKRFYIESDIGLKPSLQTLTGVGSKNRTSKENSRRIQVLNKLFMKNITDLMVTGQLSVDLIGRGLEISRVAVSPDFNKVNIYWLAGEKEDHSAMEKLLFDIAFSLRHELSQLRVMGEVPRIEFIKDKHYERVMKVERLLNTLDVSDDVEVPTHPEVDLTTEKTDEQKEYVNVNNNNNNLRSNEEREETQKIKQIEDELPLPLMQHTTLNLDHTKIMNRVRNAVDRSKALHRKDPNIEPQSSPSLSSPELESTEINDEMTHKERQEEITKYLLQRKILREKALKRNKKYGPNTHLTVEEENELPYEFLKYTETYDNEQDYDYIEESSDEKETCN